jgi:2-oxoisovalerate dehydrogenase E2 component (dihydrolipoyl transacylase)
MAETSRVTMPQLGESVHEGTISRWLVQPGERVEEFEPLLEVDTDKVNAEVPSPVTGILKEILAPEGETVEAGSEIALVELDGSDGGGRTPGPAPAAAMPAVSPNGEAPSEGPAEPAAPERDDQGRRRYSPAVLLLAQENDLDLSAVSGTGMGGRVTKKDVRDFLARGEARAATPEAPAEAVQAAPAPGPAPVETSSAPAPPKTSPAPAPAPVPAPPSRVEGGPDDEAVPLTRIRRLIGENMTLSKTTIPHAWQVQEADMSGVVANRNRNKQSFAGREGFSLTYLPYVLGAAVSALREHPAVNATFNGDEILVHKRINLGVTVGLEDTLVVPVIRDADSLSVAGLARAVNDVATRARSRKLKADDLAGGTFTVNNSGTFGTIFSYSVINPGQAAILTMEAIQERPVAVNGMVGVKPMMYICFSFDHRVLDGLQAGRYIVSVKRWLEGIAPETPIY